jgi:hypothetical protein
MVFPWSVQAMGSGGGIFNRVQGRADTKCADECRIRMLHYSHYLTSKGHRMTPKPSATLPGTVEKIIKPPHPNAPEKAQIAVEGADHLYKELRIENNLTDENGNEVRLKQGAKVDVTVEAEPEATTRP